MLSHIYGFTPADINALSLPQFGNYINNIPRVIRATNPWAKRDDEDVDEEEVKTGTYHKVDMMEFAGVDQYAL